MFVKTFAVFTTVLVASFAHPENTKLYGSSGATGIGKGPAVGGHGVALEVDSTNINDLGPGVGGAGLEPVTGVAHGSGVGGVHGTGPSSSIGVSYGVSTGSCRYWCRTPQGQVYCCEGNKEPMALPSIKPGQCPPVRPQCPPVRYFRSPTSCSNDSKCPGAEKCCFDNCLEHHTCKFPIQY